MKVFVRVLLIVSIAVNFVGGGLMLREWVFRGRDPETRRAAIARRIVTAKSAIGESAKATAAVFFESVIPALGSADAPTRDPKYVKAKLIADGVPAIIAQSMARHVAEEKYGLREAMAAVPPLDRPGPDHRPGSESYLERKRQLEEQRLRISEIREMALADVGPLEIEPTPAMIAQEKARYGDLPQETIKTLQKLEQSGREITDAEFVAEVRPLLTTGQYDEYLKYNTLLARTVQQPIASIETDEATYLALLDGAVQREGTATPDLKADAIAERNRGIESVGTYRRILGDEKFLKTLLAWDRALASGDEVYQLAGVPADTRAELFLEAYALREEYRKGGDRQEMARAAATLYQSLVQKAGLTPGRLEQFDHTELGSTLKRGAISSGSPTIRTATR